MKNSINLNSKSNYLLLFCLLFSFFKAQVDFPWIGNETEPCVNPGTNWYLGGNNILAPNPGPQILGNPPPSYTIQNDVGTCNNYDFILKSNNNQLVFITTAKKIGLGWNNNLPNALLDIFDNSNSNTYHTLIKGDQNGSIITGYDMNLISGNDLLLNYPNHSKFSVIENGSLRFRIQNGITQNFGNLIIGNSSYTPPITAMAMIDAKNSNGLKIDADNGNDAIQINNSSGAGRFRMWINNGGGEDTKFHIAAAGQIGFMSLNYLLDNSCRLNLDAQGNSFDGLKISSNNSNVKAIYVSNNNSTPFEVMGDGKTHIGTWRPNPNGPCANALLTVSGQILAWDIRVAISQGNGVNHRWADYVFEKEYKLMSLQDVENFIYKNQHLPDLPPENDVIKNGVDLISVNIAMLKKIEELYLYVIHLEKKVNSLNDNH